MGSEMCIRDRCHAIQRVIALVISISPDYSLNCTDPLGPITITNNNNNYYIIVSKFEISKQRPIVFFFQVSILFDLHRPVLKMRKIEFCVLTKFL